MLITIRPGSIAEALVVRRQAAIAASQPAQSNARKGRGLTKEMPVPVRRPILMRQAQQVA